MKKRILVVLSTLLAISSYTQAQVKIGNNPTTINANSLIELESTNKGFLAPRMALNSLVSATPMTAPVPAGMLVYSSGGSLTDGFYYWDGTKWLAVISSGSGRTWYVLVKGLSNFPAPVSGIITLAANTVYEINGTISLTSRINLNGSSIIGMDAVNDKLIYTLTTNELFTGSNGGTIKNLTLQASGVGSKLFNLDALNAVKNLTIENCYISSCDRVGTLKGFAGTVKLKDITYTANTNGIIFDNITNLVLNNLIWESSNRNIYEKYNGTFNLIQKLGGATFTLVGNTATGMDVSTVTAVLGGELKNVFFSGTGTKVAGTFSKEWEVQSTGIKEEKDDGATGSIYLATPVLTNIVTVNVPVKMAGTTASTNLFRTTAPVSNRIVYTGTITRDFQVLSTMCLTTAAVNKYCSVSIAKNGVVIASTKQKTKVANAADQNSLTVMGVVSLAPNDYVEIWVENNTDNTDLTVQTFYFTIK